MSKTIRAATVAAAMYRDGKHKTMVHKWYAITAEAAKAELEKIVAADRLAMPDATFRTHYAQYLHKAQR